MSIYSLYKVEPPWERWKQGAQQKVRAKDVEEELIHVEVMEGDLSIHVIDFR